MKACFDEFSDDELIEHLQEEFDDLKTSNIGETPFDADAAMVQAALTRNQTAALDRIATALEAIRDVFQNVTKPTFCQSPRGTGEMK